MGRNQDNPPVKVLKLLAEAFNRIADADAAKKAAQPTVGKRIKLRKAVPPKDGKK